MTRRPTTKRRRGVSPAVTPRTLKAIHVDLCRSFQQPRQPKFLPRVLHLLHAGRAVLPEALVGMALWNLLPAASAGAAPPPEFQTLLRTILDLGLKEAQRLHDEIPDSPFPPYPEQLVLESSRRLQESAGTIRGQLEVCVAKSFAELKHVVIPRAWSACTLFWSDVGGPSTTVLDKRSTWSSSEGIAGNLRLPDGGVPHPVRLDAHVSLTPLEARTDFTVHDAPNFASCRGFVRVVKEPGRPGAARVTSERAVRFSDTCKVANDLRLTTVDYWLRADIAGLVLESSGAKRSGG